MNTAIIVAAGSGSRFNSETPKQFHELLGKPVIIHTLERFDACAEIDEIVLVLAESDVDTFAAILSSYSIEKRVTVVAGGRTRAHSVANGLNAVDPGTAVVAVHDGARPLVTPEEIGRTIRRAAETGAACLVAALTDTVKEVDGDHIIGTLDRRSLRRALTPQAFEFGLLKRAFADESAFDVATDECYLVEQLGASVTAVPGSSRNIKITFPDDITIAEALLKEEEN